MGQFKGTMFFVGGQGGWTESHFVKGAAIEDATTSLTNIITARLPILQTFCGIINATISDTTIRGDSTNIITAYEPGTYTDTSGYLDLDLALLIRWQGGSFNRCKTFLRGMGANNFNSGKYVPFTGTATKVADYVDAVVLNSVLRQLKAVHAVPPVPSDYEYVANLGGVPNIPIARRKTGRPTGLPRGRRLAG